MASSFRDALVLHHPLSPLLNGPGPTRTGEARGEQGRGIRGGDKAKGAEEEGRGKNPIRGRRRTRRWYDGARDKNGTGERVASGAWAQERGEGCGDPPEGPRIGSTGAVHAPRPQPPPYPTASSGFIIQHLLPGDEVGVASRAEVG